MKAYRFRLEGVARIRALQERVAAQQLAHAAATLRLAEHALDRARSALAGLQMPGGTTSVGALLWTHDQADRLDDARRRRADEVQTATASLHEARRAWGAARKRCAMLERLDDRQRALWQEEFDRSEAKQLDDMASLRFVREGARR